MRQCPTDQPGFLTCPGRTLALAGPAPWPGTGRLLKCAYTADWHSASGPAWRRPGMGNSDRR